jgi:recombinational DNA repair ATPase RecF
MDDALLELVLKRLDQVPLPSPAEKLLLAACDGDAALAAELSGESRQAGGREESRTATEPAGAYLRSVTVSGFRGIGGKATLELEPGPGLTVIVGRNGSGKSSFAEGLELLLTGELKRWQGPGTTAWRAGWRNMHQPEGVTLSAELLLEDTGNATVERSWPAGADLTQSRADVQVAGERRSDLNRLGWQGDLVTYRPFLSHAELEAFLRGPSQLYDLLSGVLGLDDLDTAEKLLNAARKAREDSFKVAYATLPALLAHLGTLNDERARSCREVLSGRSPDIQRALAIATGSSAAQPDGDIGRLRSLSQLTVPTHERADETAAALRAAAKSLAEATESEAGQALALAKLLTAALDHYHAHGPGPCPVCGREAALDDHWSDEAQEEVNRLTAVASRAEAASTAAAAAREDARELFVPTPAVLTGPAIGIADPGPAHAAWKAWTARPDSLGKLTQLADHIEQAWPALSHAVVGLTTAASDELRDREDQWTPLAKEVVTWCKQAQDASEAAAAVPSLKEAISWLKKATDEIRNDRLAPLAEQARSIWSALRQESNVDLGAIRLSGSATRRQVDLNVTVDGEPGAALGVMSQGEINALALSIFLPRATVSASPFRFLVIDDPVQAMDPAKVEGLARVLEYVARSRQVLVFTHDDRLPEAVRRLGIGGHILEVTRRPGSVVEVRSALTPVQRLLKDAQDMCADKDLPEGVAARVIPGLCRLAVEAAFTESARRMQLAAGKRHAEVEASIEAADKLSKKAALAMFGDVTKAGDVLSRLNSWHRSAGDTYKALNKGAHEAHHGSLRSLVADAKALAELISTKLT